MTKPAILVNTLHSGGAERQSIILFNVLKKELPTTLIVLNPEKTDQKLLDLIEGENYTLVKLEGSIFNKYKTLRDHFKQNSTTHIFNFLTKPNLIGAMAGKSAKVNYIYSGIRTTKLPFWKFVIEKYVSNHLTTGTIYNSYSGEKIFSKRGLKNGIVISNCFPSILNSIEREVENKTIHIISVGRFVEAKDYLTSILTIKQLIERSVNIHFTIVGYGVLENQIKQWITKYNLGNHISMIINPKNIPQLLINSDIYLSTSLFEGTSNSIMEAMNASLPVVATDVGDNQLLVKDGRNGFISSVSDSNSLATTIQKIIKNPELRIKMGVESNKILRENFSLNKFRDEYLKLLK